MPKRKEDFTEAVRAIVKNLSHEDVLIIATALDTYKAVLDSLDRNHPNPEQRDEAARAEVLAGQVFYRANTARAFLEEQDGWNFAENKRCEKCKGTRIA